MSGSGKGPLRIAIEDFLGSFDPSKLYENILGKFGTFMLNNIFGRYVTVLDQTANASTLPWLKDLAATHSTEMNFAEKALVLGMMVVSIALSLGGALFQPFGRLVTYTAERTALTARLPIEAFLRLYRIHPEKVAPYVPDYHELGWSDERIQTLLAAADQEVDLGSLIALYLRGEIDESVFRTRAYRLGYNPEQAKDFLTVAQKIPGPGDLISMAVREAWDDNVSARFSYDVGLPEPFVEWMTKQGYSADWCKRYWRQHWTIPGVSQAYEMLHRLRPGVSDNPFTLADMELLLKTADIPEFFRKRLIDTSYNPYTRVDVRRLYGTGVITEQQVKSNYLDLGYDEEHATNLTTFTCQGAKAEEKGITPSVITGLYHDALLGREAAKTMLTDLGYSPENAEYLLLLVDVSLDQANVNAQLADIQTRYVDGELDESALQGALGPLNLASDRQTQLLAKWQILRRNHIKRPSSSQLEAFYKLSLIDSAAYTAGLLAAGYLGPDAELFLSQTDTEIQAGAVKEAARAQTAADGAVASTTANPAKIQLAQLDVDIAYDRLQIANARVAGHAELTPEQQKTLADQVDQLNIDIADLNYQKAQVHLGAL
jgi:hypothetical protein